MTAADIASMQIVEIHPHDGISASVVCEIMGASRSSQVVPAKREPQEMESALSRPFAPNVRFERVESLRKAIASGQYRVEASALADCLMAHMRRS
jgi:flagellar biosynthesis anti-sigma factor FlgM